MKTTVGVLALQGAFLEHLTLLRRAADFITKLRNKDIASSFDFIEVRTPQQLSLCDALIIPGGESTTISLVAADSGLLEPLRDFVKVHRKPTWGTCAGLILLAESANRTKKGGQELVGGLDVRVNRNHFGRQVESFQAELNLPFLAEIGDLPTGPFPGIFIRAPIVERLLPNVEGIQKDEQAVADTVVAPPRQIAEVGARKATSQDVKIMASLAGRLKRAGEAGAKTDAEQSIGDIIAVQQGNVFGTSFHPELSSDIRIHVWWLMQVVERWIPGNGAQR